MPYPMKHTFVVWTRDDVTERDVKVMLSAYPVRTAIRLLEVPEDNPHICILPGGADMRCLACEVREPDPSDDTLEDEPENSWLGTINDIARDAVEALDRILLHYDDNKLHTVDFDAARTFVREAMRRLTPEADAVPSLPEWYEAGQREVPPALLGIMHESMDLGRRGDVAANDAMRAALAAMHFYEGPPVGPRMAIDSLSARTVMANENRERHGTIGVLASMLSDTIDELTSCRAYRQELEREVERLHREQMAEAVQHETAVTVGHTSRVGSAEVVTSLTIDHLRQSDVGAVIETLRESGWGVEINLGERHA